MSAHWQGRLTVDAKTHSVADSCLMQVLHKHDQIGSGTYTLLQEVCAGKASWQGQALIAGLRSGPRRAQNRSLPHPSPGLLRLYRRHFPLVRSPPMHHWPEEICTQEAGPQHPSQSETADAAVTAL